MLINYIIIEISSFTTNNGAIKNACKILSVKAGALPSNTP
jgi:hypothetical protein